MTSRECVVVAALAGVMASSCAPGFGEPGVNGRLGFETHRECYDGCDQLRGIAVGAVAVVHITDRECAGTTGDFTVSASEPLEITHQGLTEREGDRCWTSIHVAARSEGVGWVRATSPSGTDDAYRLFGAVATTITMPESVRGWAGRAETERVVLTVGDLWSGEVRVTDERRRPLLHGPSNVVWSTADPSVLARVGDEPGLEDLFRAIAPGETTLTASHLDLTVSAPVTIVEP